MIPFLGTKEIGFVEIRKEKECSILLTKNIFTKEFGFKQTLLSCPHVLFFRTMILPKLEVLGKQAQKIFPMHRHYRPQAAQQELTQSSHHKRHHQSQRMVKYQIVKCQGCLLLLILQPHVCFFCILKFSSFFCSKNFFT